MRRCFRRTDRQSTCPNRTGLVARFKNADSRPRRDRAASATAGPVLRAQLVEDRRHMELHRSLGDLQRRRDLPVREAGRDEAEHAQLPRAQRARAPHGLGHVLDEHRRDSRAQVRIACVDLPDRLSDLRGRQSLQQIASRAAAQRLKHVRLCSRVP